MVHATFQRSRITKILSSKIFFSFKFIKKNYLNSKYSGSAKISILFLLKKKLWPRFVNGVQLSPDYRISKHEETVYSLPISPQMFLVLI